MILSTNQRTARVAQTCRHPFGCLSTTTEEYCKTSTAQSGSCPLLVVETRPVPHLCRLNRPTPCAIREGFSRGAAEQPPTTLTHTHTHSYTHPYSHSPTHTGLAYTTHSPTILTHSLTNSLTHTLTHTQSHTPTDTVSHTQSEFGKEEMRPAKWCVFQCLVSC